MIEDAKIDGLKRNVIEELNEFPLDDPSMFHDTSHPSIETSVSASSPFPSPPADDPLPALTTPSPEGSTSMNPPNRHLSPRAATTTATTGLTRSSCHSLPPSLPLFNISKPLRSNYNELYISYRVYRQS